MNEPTPYQLAKLALTVLKEHRDWTDSRALQWAYNFWQDAQVCINNNIVLRDNEERKQRDKVNFEAYLKREGEH